jgi:hypothetical protein
MSAHRRITAWALVLLAAPAVAVPALASWTTSGTGKGGVTTATLNAPQTVTAQGVSAGTVDIAVTAGPASGAPVSGYRVDRVSPSPATGVCFITGTIGQCSAATSGTGSNAFSVFSYRGAGASPTWTSATGSPAAAAPISVATTFAFTSAPVSGPASVAATLGPVTVTRQTAGGVAVVSPAGGTAVGLTSTSTGTVRFALTSGGASVTAVTIPEGSSSVSFYYGDTKAGAPVISASGSLAGATQAQTVTAATPSLAFSTCTSPATKNATFTTAVTRTGADAFGNTTGTAAVTVTLSPFDASGSNHNFVVGTVTLAAGSLTSSNLTFHTANGVGTATFTATAAGFQGASCSVTTT